MVKMLGDASVVDLSAYFLTRSGASRNATRGRGVFVCRRFDRETDNEWMCVVVVCYLIYHLFVIREH